MDTLFFSCDSKSISYLLDFNLPICAIYMLTEDSLKKIKVGSMGQNLHFLQLMYTSRLDSQTRTVYGFDDVWEVSIIKFQAIMSWA
jgi:hypothetical protein